MKYSQGLAQNPPIGPQPQESNTSHAASMTCGWYTIHSQQKKKLKEEDQ